MKGKLAFDFMILPFSQANLPSSAVIFPSRWTYNADMARFTDEGGNTNNYVEVAADEDAAQTAQRERVLADGCVLTEAELALIRSRLVDLAP